MKEEDAKKKKCPRLVQEIIVSDGVSREFDCCIGSDCMMWVETDREASPTPPDGDTIFFDAGYCGLVNKR